MLLAHARAVDIYRTKFQPSQGGVIGITLNANWTGDSVLLWLHTTLWMTAGHMCLRTLLLRDLHPGFRLAIAL